MVTAQNINEAEQFLERLLNQASEEPLDNNIRTSEITLPPWYDEKLFKRGQEYYHKYLTVMFTGMLSGLVAVLSVPTILKVLICTGQSDTIVKSYKRYVKTIFHVMAWHSYDLKPGTKCWQSLESVRKIHSNAGKLCLRKNGGSITQKDLSLTQFGFMGFTTLKAKELGINYDKDYLNATCHLWRVIGYIMGIKDEYNLCNDTWETTKPRLELILNRIYRPSLIHDEQNFIKMSQILINGLWYFLPFLSVGSIMFLTKYLAGCKDHEYFKSDFDKEISIKKNNNSAYKNYSILDRLLIFRVIFFHKFLYKYTIIRIYTNIQLYIAVFLAHYFPYLAIFKFGIKEAYIQIFKDNKTTDNHYN